MSDTTALGLNIDSVPQDAASWEDDRLAQELREGNDWAFEALVQRFQQPVFNLIYRLMETPADVNDVVQEVFLKVFRNIGSFRNQSSLKTWIYRIAVNEVHNYRRWVFRHKGREVTLEDDSEGHLNLSDSLTDGSRSPFDLVLDLENLAMVEAALANINPLFRAAVVLRDIEDLSYEQISDILGISMGTVKSRILRGREALREQLGAKLSPRPALNLNPQLAD